MTEPSSMVRKYARFLDRLARDTAGNTIMIIAASLLPLMAMVGGGLDIGRGYLVQARLQQACDAGVLAARKRLGTEAVVSGTMPSETALIGDRFFKTNFRDASYGSTNRDFQMTLENDYTITGDATARLPTTIMGIFGQEYIEVAADCSAQLNMANTDIMMVLDVTGSMALTNAGDTDSRIDVLKDTVRSFYAQLAASSSATSRLRYGFLPYSINVNVGDLLKDTWVVSTWDYQSREEKVTGNTLSVRTYDRAWTHISGTRSEPVVESTYDATWHPGSGSSTYIDENENVVVVNGAGYYTCDTPAPPDTRTRIETILGVQAIPFLGPPIGVQTIEKRQRVENGKDYWLSREDATCIVRSVVSDDYIETYERVTEPLQTKKIEYWYDQLEYDVTDWRTISNGCIEERDTYEIDDYDNVDFARALDLDIDRIPSDNASRWRPMYRDVVYARSMLYNGSGTFVQHKVKSEENFVAPTAIGAAPCPAAARKLGAMTSAELDTYLDTLNPSGATYHDIGMIWGGRMMSPTGLFAAENADVSITQPTARHMIFLTDGETETLDLAYSAYGLEPLDQRRWSQASSLSLTQTVENRFTVACNEVKKRGITVWVIGFGTFLGDFMKDCAGEGHYFEAADAAELNTTFAAIATSLTELRITN